MKIKSLFKILLLSVFISVFTNAQDTFDAESNYDKTKKRTNEYIIENVEDSNTGYINLGNLQIGQSGIVVNTKGASIIVGIGSVVESDNSRSKLKFDVYTNLKQDAIPNTNLKVSNGDIFILNYLYEASMVIAPNIDSFQAVRKKFSHFNFLHPDLFASFLKIEELPVPTQEIIQKYAKEQNLGTIVFVVENKAHVVDSRTFKVVESLELKYENKEYIEPFYTRVEKIESGVFDFGVDSIGKYTKYYKNLLDIK